MTIWHLVLAAGLWLAQSPPQSTITSQVSTGDCSPNIINSGGGIVNFVCTAPLLEKQIRDLLLTMDKSQKTINFLNKLLKKQDSEIQDWIKKYRELKQQLALQSQDDELSKQAATALQDGDLDLAAKLLKEILPRDRKNVDRAAQDEFNLAQALDLSFEPVEALDYYKTAYQLRPDTVRFGMAYAELLYREKKFQDALPVFEHIRDLATSNPHGDKSDLAGVLDDLGITYTDLQRPAEAETALKEALKIRQDQATSEPVIYSPFVASILSNLFRLYVNNRELEKAKDAFQQAIRIYQQLSQGNPLLYLPGEAFLITNLGNYWRMAGDMTNAESAYERAVVVYRQLVALDPQSYRPQLSVALTNLGMFNTENQRPEIARSALMEALGIRRELVKENSPAYSPDLANTLHALGNLEDGASHFDEAERYFNEAVGIYSELPEATRQLYADYRAKTLIDEATALDGAGIEYAKTEYLEKAELSFTKAIDILRAPPIPDLQRYAAPRLADALRNRGHIYRDRKEFAKSAADYEEALTIFRNLAKTDKAQYRPWEAEALSNLGTVYKLDGKSAEAIPLCDESIAIYKELAAGDPAAYGSAGDLVCKP